MKLPRPLAFTTLAGLVTFAVGCGDEKTAPADTQGTSDTATSDTSSSDDADASGDTTGTPDAPDAPDATDATDTADAEGGLTIATFCASFASNLCESLATCTCDHMDACVTSQTTGCEVGLSSFIGGVTLGDLTFVPADAERCIAETRAFASSCKVPDPRSQPRACNTFLVDPAAIEGTCSAFGRGLRCAEGNGYCTRETGLCVPLALVGPCESRSACADDRTCDAGRCAPISNTGEACESNAGCALDLVCMTDKKCAAPGGKDAECADPSQCGAGLACVGGRCADALALGTTCTDQVCGPAASCVADEGRTCELVGQVNDTCSGMDRDCAPGLVCDFTRSIPTCQAPPGLGAPCLASACAAGLTCDFEVSLCKTAPALGESCQLGTSRPCAEGLACDNETSLCAEVGGEGEPCVGFDNGCAAGLKCDDSSTPATCRPPGDAGAACGTDDSRCKDGLFCNFADNKCAPQVALGAACDHDTACGPAGRCDFSTENPTCVAAPSTVGEACDWMCGNGLRCAPAKGTCTSGACLFLR